MFLLFLYIPFEYKRFSDGVGVWWELGVPTWLEHHGCCSGGLLGVITFVYCYSAGEEVIYDWGWLID